MRIARRATTTMVALILLLIPALTATAAGTNQDRAAWASGYVSLGQRKNGSIPAFSPVGSTADAVIAYVVARRGPVNIKRAVNYLRVRVEAGAVDDNVGLTAKVILAVVASGGNPRNFGGHDLVNDITATEQPDGRYGEFTAVFDQSSAILALVGAGEAPSNNAKNWLHDAQCPDGGWQYDGPPGPNEDEHCQNTVDPFSDYFATDTNTSALAVMALEASSAGAPATNPFDFFAAIRDVDLGGWGYTWGYDTTDANSTSMVIQAYKAGGETLPDGARGALRALQYGRCGAFAFTWDTSGPEPVRTGPNLGATIGAIPGLLGRPLPVNPAPVTKNPPAPIGCPLS